MKSRALQLPSISSSRSSRSGKYMVLHFLRRRHTKWISRNCFFNYFIALPSPSSLLSHQHFVAGLTLSTSWAGTMDVTPTQPSPTQTAARRNEQTNIFVAIAVYFAIAISTIPFQISSTTKVSTFMKFARSKEVAPRRTKSS